MKTYAEWCQHYDYNPATEAAKADYQRYREQLALFQSMAKKPTETCRDHG